MSKDCAASIQRQKRLADVTQYQLVAAIGPTQAWVSLEQPGHVSPSPNDLPEIAASLRVEPRAEHAGREGKK